MLTRYYIETVRSGYANGGMGCGGWRPGPATAEIKVKTDDGDRFYLSVSKYDDGICFYRTQESTFDKQIEEVNDQSFWDELDDKITAAGDSLNEVLMDSSDDPLCTLYEYLSVVLKEVKQGEVTSVGHYVDEVI